MSRLQALMIIVSSLWTLTTPKFTCNATALPRFGMFMCYNISNGADKLDALKKTAAHLAAQPKGKQEGKIVEMPDRAEAVSE